jgi:hypothetical protein
MDKIVDIFTLALIVALLWGIRFVSWLRWGRRGDKLDPVRRWIAESEAWREFDLG